MTLIWCSFGAARGPAGSGRMEAERFLLKWNNHQTNLVTVFDQLYEQEAFTDVTLACDGRTFAAHKVILSACSPYFQALFLGNPCKHPIIFMRDVRAGDMEALLSFMYRGEINVHQHDLSSFLRTAESLQIKGLSDSSERHKETSKILEAMERKFCSSNMQQQQQQQQSQPSLNACTPTLGGAALGGALVPTVGVGDSPPPPSKKFKSLDDLPRILPKMKPLATPPGLVTPVPGLLTPITLAATVMKNAAHAAHAAQNARVSPPTPETTNSSPTTDASTPPKDRKKVPSHTVIEVDRGQDDCKTTFIEGYISGDSPHPVYLVSSVGGVAAATSGNSTPSHEVKVEEEDPLDDTNSFSDDPISGLGDNDDGSMDTAGTGDWPPPLPQGVTVKDEPLDAPASPCTPPLTITALGGGTPEGRVPGAPFSGGVPEARYATLQALLLAVPRNTRAHAPQEPRATPSPAREEAAASCHGDHTYPITAAAPATPPALGYYRCSTCGRVFPRGRRHRYLSHLRTHTGVRPYQCPSCGRGFGRRDHLQVHMRLHTGERPFCCPSCGAAFTHKVSLRNHRCPILPGGGGAGPAPGHHAAAVPAPDTPPAPAPEIPPSRASDVSAPGPFSSSPATLTPASGAATAPPPAPTLVTASLTDPPPTLAPTSASVPSPPPTLTPASASVHAPPATLTPTPASLPASPPTLNSACVPGLALQLRPSYSPQTGPLCTTPSPPLSPLFLSPPHPGPATPRPEEHPTPATPPTDDPPGGDEEKLEENEENDASSTPASPRHATAPSKLLIHMTLKLPV
ncbi:nascent polypeptide-associated complex subunit alpha, muscle-specific form-like isoform X2 [Eriocheir sinensis]|uniref:nascent polypeptide-associated complex subunit alpha, muscle-specific form-like isoform X2 n=1 Tax=Eriocheir sinensis TaxID=95602 RepID=UPI0021C5C3AF|nr:nascent polypeptide-associated complex subunit alpha, muscle-specific form-like isoform X2 [Eriocheir sinensis]